MDAVEPRGKTGPRCDPVTQILCLERKKKGLAFEK